jgi:hypothetical protein
MKYEPFGKIISLQEVKFQFSIHKNSTGLSYVVSYLVTQSPAFW